MCNIAVAPLVGAWIEIYDYDIADVASVVAPLVGAWIEITKAFIELKLDNVAPLVGAWIEINIPYVLPVRLASLLSWERGLKLQSTTSRQ